MSSARINSYITAGGLLLQQVLGFLSGIYVAKLLGPEDYGQVSVLRNLLQLIMIVTPLGLDLAIFKILPAFDHDPSVKKIHFQRFRLIALLTGVGSTLIGSGIIGPLLHSNVYSYQGFEAAFALTLVAVPFATDLVLLTAWYRVEGRIVPIMLITYYVQPIVRTGLNILAVWLGYGVIGVVVGTTIAYAFAALVALSYRAIRARLATTHAPASTSVPNWRESWGLFLGAPGMALNLFVYNVMRSADLIIVAAIVPTWAVGEYAVVSNISQLVPVAALSLSQTLGPAIARYHQAGDTIGIQRDMNHYIRWASIVSSFVFGGIAAFGAHLDVLFGEEYQPRGAILILLPLGYLLSATLAPTGYALTMCGKALTELRILAISAAVLIFMCIGLAQTYSVVGAGVAVLLVFAGGNVARLIAVNRSLGITLGRSFDLVPPVLALALGNVANLAVVPIKPNFGQLLIGCVVYAAAYSGIMTTLVKGQRFIARPSTST
ncbi:lipopolysaccharide biosynthesis protein [Sphingomonas sp. CCH5-D11]|uniref:lipopolysaccharide biosynthesis protein n=1 Tax=Sphingomonas sp. CCH5-D11 TaxID=1768786 RepID=UPI00082AC92E|nr:lipopolysaccharide biosynthesis protein [Sphingomonas sp. CCH5-D11]